MINLKCPCSAYYLESEHIRSDLTADRPIWILSSYGPGKSAPRQLFGGLPREQSFEEMRARHYELAAQGRQQEAIQEAQTLFDNANQQNQTALNDLKGAMQYVSLGEQQHPNRNDICRETSTTATVGSQPMSAPSPSGFGSVPTGSSFGRPSAPAQQPSRFGQSSAFRSTSSPFAPRAHAQFAQPSVTSGAPAARFGQPSNPFAQTRAAQQSGFSQPSAPASSQSQTSFTNTQAQPASNTSFGKPSQGSNGAFGSQGNSIPAVNPFVKPQETGTSSFGQASSLNAPAETGGQLTDARKDAQGKLVSWKGKPVTYVDDEPCFKRPDGAWEKIWFPEPPVWKNSQEPPDDAYDEATKEAYRYAKKHGRFPGDKIPLLPPKKEWISWDF